MVGEEQGAVSRKRLRTHYCLGNGTIAQKCLLCVVLHSTSLELENVSIAFMVCHDFLCPVGLVLHLLTG